MSFYVKRTLFAHSGPRARVGWVGPIRSAAQAAREAAAWDEAGWTAEVLPSTPELRRTVNRWAAEARRAEAVEAGR